MRKPLPPISEPPSISTAQPQQCANPPEIQGRDAAGRVSLEPEQIRRLHKEVAAVIDQSSAGNVSDATGRQYRINVLKVAVVSHVNRSAGVDEIGDQEIRIEVLGRVQRSEPRSCEDCTVLSNEAK